MCELPTHTTPHIWICRKYGAMNRDFTVSYQECMVLITDVPIIHHLFYGTYFILISLWHDLPVVYINSFRPRQHGRHFADDIFKCIFLDKDVWIPIKISLKFVPKGPINNIPALVQIMAWRHPGDKPLSEPTMVSLPTHVCVARPQ